MSDYRRECDSMSVFTGNKYKGKSQKERIKEITEQLEEGVRSVFTSDNYKNFLDFCSKFYSYSTNNCLLIALQKPDASL